VSGDDAVRQHYARPGLEALILDAFAASGRSPGTLTIDDLSAVDEFHMGGRRMTAELAEALRLGPEHRLLDIGCGLGGPARYFARHSGCRVSGVDLTADYIGAAAGLTRRVGLEAQVDFQVASALDLPFAAGSFDAATVIHVGMNVADKARLFAEAGRVLKPGARLVVYDVMQIGPGDLAFPVAWAANRERSFLAAPQAYRRAVADAGFVVTDEQDRAEVALAAFRRARAHGLPPLGLHLLMGPDTPAKIANMIAGLEGGCISPLLMVAVRG
jgi:SAM-dependent methyltransferase